MTGAGIDVLYVLIVCAALLGVVHMVTRRRKP